MECPFRTPVYRAIKSEKHDYYSIRQVADGGLICRKMTKAHADYIIQAINSHKKLVEAFGLARSMLLGGEDMTPKAEEIFKQALEAEKKE